MGKLSTHVLDTANGCPAAGMKIELYSLAKDRAPVLMKQEITNADGRTNSLILTAEEMKIGCFELQFYVEEYFSRAGVLQSDPAFLNIVPIRFNIFDMNGNFHIPLLVSPWSYSTYKGS